MALGLGGLFFHREDQAVCIDFGDAGFVEFGFVGFVVPHNAGGALGCGIVEELLEAEGKEVVAGHNEEVRCPVGAGHDGVDAQLDISDRTQPCFVA